MTLPDATIDLAAKTQALQIEEALIRRRAVSLDQWTSAQLEHEMLQRALDRTQLAIKRAEATLIALFDKRGRQTLEYARQSKQLLRPPKYSDEGGSTINSRTP